MSVDFNNDSREKLIAYFFEQLKEAVESAEPASGESKEKRYQRVASKYQKAIANLPSEKLLRAALINLDNIPMELVADQADTSSVEELQEVIRLTAENFEFD